MERKPLLSWITIPILLLQGVAGQFTAVPSDEVSINKGDTMSLSCSHSSATNIVWSKDGQTITASNTNFNIASRPGESNLTLIEANLDTHNGTYSCVAALSGGGEDTAIFSVFVHFIGEVSVNVITDQCSEGVVYVEFNITLKCSVDDSQPAITNYSWFLIRDTGPEPVLPGANINFNSSNQYLNFFPVASTDAGDYLCRAHIGGDLSKDSPMSSLTVITSPGQRQITIDGPSRIIAGREALTTILCHISPPAPAFTDSDVFWTRNSETISSNIMIVLFSHACNFTLAIQHTLPSDEGTYFCNLRDVNGLIRSEGVILSLARLPETYLITTTPHMGEGPVVLGEGRNITFECMAEMSPGQQPNVEPEFSWEREGQSSFRTEGATLTLESLRLEDAGVYVCVASNNLVPSPIRTRINLTVEAPPQVFLRQPDPVRLGIPLSLTCRSTFSRPVSFSWAIGGSLITSSRRYSITNPTDMANESSLTISPLRGSDLTTVTCSVSDPLHVVHSSTVTIEETDQPYFLPGVPSDPLPVEDGTRAVLECPLRPVMNSLSVQWFRGSGGAAGGSRELMSGEDGMEIRRVSNGSSLLVLGPVSLSEDEGDVYTCLAVEPGIEHSITLFVTVPGNITDFPSAESNATEGASFQLDCVVSGKPRPVVMWLQNGTTIVSNRTHPDIEDLQNGTLLFRNVRPEHRANYVCFIRDPIITRTTALNVLPPPKSDRILGLNEPEAILVFGMVGIVILLLFMVVLALLVLCCCRLANHIPADQYQLPKDSLDGSFMRQSSVRSGKDNSGVLMGTPTPIFETLRRSPQGSPSHPSHEDNSYGIPLNTFHAGSTSFLTDSHTSSPLHAGMISSSIQDTPIHNTTTVSSPLHGTMASTSLYTTTDEHVTLENGLPNFPRNNVKLGELMGQGEFGPVMKAVARNLVQGQPETQVAVKLLVTDTVDDTGFRADLAVEDYATQMKLEYKNIASILGICSDKEPYYVIYEYLDGGNLKNFLLESHPEENAPPTFPPEDLLKMIVQVADGMAYLFSQRIIHGDIATRNCLVSSSLTVKIGDLGIGHELYPGDYYDNGAQLLPIRWMSPELLTDSEEGPSFSLHSDVWSFGVFCWEVLSHASLPYGNYSDEEVLAMVPVGSRLRNPSKHCPPTLYLIMMECWSEVPESRPQFNRILATLETAQLEAMQSRQ